MVIVSNSVAFGKALIHPSIEKSFVPKFMEGELDTMTRSSLPSKLKPCPAIPLPKESPLSKTPVLPPTTSVPLPSAGHHEINPDGGEKHGGMAFTVSRAFELTSVSTELVMSTE